VRQQTIATSLTFGASVTASGTEFRVWAPKAKLVQVRLEKGELMNLPPESPDVFSATLPAGPGDRYFYTLDQGHPLPDPVSRYLPEGVHGPTEIVDPSAFRWTDARWKGIPREDYIIYELHVGTFTPQGTFDGVVEKFEYLKRLGITAIEVMPVAAFPGRRNWGYDGASLYAVQASYGGPDGLKRLVNGAHQAGLAVMLDVVYNHLGPEGNYLQQFGPYFSGRHKTPWGDAINFDGPEPGPVRRYFIDNALYWIREYHMDGLRLDAIQGIRDDSPRHIVAEINAEVQRLAGELDRRVCVIAETDSNDPVIVQPSSGSAGSPHVSFANVGHRAETGRGLCALWSDDFHHAIHTVLTGENEGYYQDFGRKEQIVRALNEGFAFQGEHFKYWDAPRGAPPTGVPLPAHVICIQNHDQVGNRALGERLNQLVPRGAFKVASALLLLAPHTPLLFMGQEYGEQAPFQFFADFGDPALQKAVSEGRRNEFKHFTWNEVPDPEDPQTFERSKLKISPDNEMFGWYRSLLELRHRIVMRSERTCHAELRDGNIMMRVPANESKLVVVAEFPDSGPRKTISPGNEWRLVLNSDEEGYAVRVYENQY
jgi:maltooligosyltrehalose trehalohydrolase